MPRTTPNTSGSPDAAGGPAASAASTGSSGPAGPRPEDTPPPTIADVAREAAVSKTTASDALRGHGRVSGATRDAVEAAARRLGYSPNRNARSLRTSVTETIALHIPEFLTSAEYYMSFVFGVIEQATRASLNVTMISSGHLPHRGALPQVDGLVLCDPMAGDPVVEALMNSGLPVVTAERYVGDKESTGVVWSDHETTTVELLDHLRDAGAARPALLASDSTAEWAATVLDTYRRWCVRNGVPDTVHKAPFGSPPDVLRAEVARMLAGSPETDAVVCAADGAAVAVLPEIRAAGRTVGKDLLLASCVDSTTMRLSDPPITAIDLRPRDMGAECARLLCEILAGRSPRGTVRSLPISLNTRASTGL
ncbi:LacI family DNA-binding transcriptional regulator [Streptomyces sp. NP-1717]|uniref:LacI family DNA-binding transcriptional regulator n=1 Tax=Streptomyces sp. NP-1717 TaxID=2704470 RepID=UPI001F5C2EC2|nr:LacI family DNA-binding transcriptional regulator [Streptomyces sp. NP-1717]MCI3226212.1 LacI family transcriptional regulator [Streptomyces sp. NP-1717]